MAAFALVVAAGGLAAQDKMTTEERQRLEHQLQEMQERLQTLREQMRDLERQLGRGSMVLVGPRVHYFPDSSVVIADSTRWTVPLTVSVLMRRQRNAPTPVTSVWHSPPGAR